MRIALALGLLITMVCADAVIGSTAGYLRNNGSVSEGWSLVLALGGSAFVNVVLILTIRRLTRKPA